MVSIAFGLFKPLLSHVFAFVASLVNVPAIAYADAVDCEGPSKGDTTVPEIVAAKNTSDVEVHMHVRCKIAMRVLHVKH
jgi:hypothetical protein